MINSHDDIIYERGINAVQYSQLISLARLIYRGYLPQPLIDELYKSLGDSPAYYAAKDLIDNKDDWSKLTNDIAVSLKDKADGPLG